MSSVQNTLLMKLFNDARKIMDETDMTITTQFHFTQFIVTLPITFSHKPIFHIVRLSHFCQNSVRSHCCDWRS